jgi:adhesin transport system outer membrane protein
MKMIQMTAPLAILTMAVTPLSAHTLDQAIERALGSNPEVLSARAAHHVAEEQLVSAQAAYLPVIDLSMTAGEEHTNKPGSAGQDMWQQDHSITLTQKLFDGGSTSSSITRSKEMLKNADTRVKDLTGTITLNVIESWYELYRLQKVSQMIGRNVEQHKKVFAQIQQKVKAGAAGKAELTAAEGPYIGALTAQVANRGQLSDALARYSKVVGEAPETALQQPLPLLATEPLPENVDQLVEQVLASAPAIRTAEANLLAAEADFIGSKAGMLPTLDLELKNLYKHDAAGTAGDEWGWTALLKMNYNLYRGGADKARERETAKAKIDSREQLNLAIRTAEEQAKINWSALQVSTQILKLNQQNMRTATETRNATNEQFKLGEADIMAIMGSEDALFQAQQTVLQEQITGAIARLRLLNQLGTLSSHYYNEPAEAQEESSELSDIELDQVLNRVVDNAEKVIEEVGGIIKESVEGVTDGVEKATEVIKEQGGKAIEGGKEMLEKVKPQPISSLKLSPEPVPVMADISAEESSWEAAYKKMKEAGWVK